MAQIRVTRIIKNPLNWIRRSQGYTNEFVALEKKKKSFIYIVTGGEQSHVNILGFMCSFHGPKCSLHLASCSAQLPSISIL